MKLQTVAFPFLLFLSVREGRAQGVVNLIGSPFSATWTVTTMSEGSVTTSSIVAARSSDGSVYRAIYKNGTIDYFEIVDVPHGRRFEVRPQARQYTETSAPDGKWVTRTSEEQQAVLEHWMHAYTRDAPGQKKELTPLGTKVINGMTVYGHRYLRTRDSVPTTKGETWQSDLGFNYSERIDDLASKRTETSSLTYLKRAEPDPSLFVLPTGYTLAGGRSFNRQDGKD